MLDTIKSFFSQKILREDEDAPSDHALHMAAAALLLEVCRADLHVDDDELKAVADALSGQFGFSEEETQELLTLALEETDEQISLHPFLRLINERFSMAQRCVIIEDMWRVAYADRRLDKYEEHQVRRVAELLYVPHSDFIRTKLKVKEEL